MRWGGGLPYLHAGYSRLVMILMENPFCTLSRCKPTNKSIQVWQLVNACMQHTCKSRMGPASLRRLLNYDLSKLSLLHCSLFKGKRGGASQWEGSWIPVWASGFLPQVNNILVCGRLSVCQPCRDEMATCLRWIPPVALWQLGWAQPRHDFVCRIRSVRW